MIVGWKSVSMGVRDIVLSLMLLGAPLLATAQVEWTGKKVYKDANNKDIIKEFDTYGYIKLVAFPSDNNLVGRFQDLSIIFDYQYVSFQASLGETNFTKNLLNTDFQFSFSYDYLAIGGAFRFYKKRLFVNPSVGAGLFKYYYTTEDYQKDRNGNFINPTRIKTGIERGSVIPVNLSAIYAFHKNIGIGGNIGYLIITDGETPNFDDNKKIIFGLNVIIGYIR